VLVLLVGIGGTYKQSAALQTWGQSACFHVSKTIRCEVWTTAPKRRVTDLPKIFSSRIVLKTRHLPVSPPTSPSRARQPHVMFKPSYAPISLRRKVFEAWAASSLTTEYARLPVTPVVSPGPAKVVGWHNARPPSSPFDWLPWQNTRFPKAGFAKNAFSSPLESKSPLTEPPLMVADMLSCMQATRE